MGYIIKILEFLPSNEVSCMSAFSVTGLPQLAKSGDLLSDSATFKPEKISNSTVVDDR